MQLSTKTLAAVCVLLWGTLAAGAATTSIDGVSGSGTADDPFIIDDLDSWDAVAEYSNENDDDLTGQYVRMDDGFTLWISEVTPFNNFNGDFDGNGCSISNVGPNVSDFSTNNFGVGFITIGEDGYVHDLTISGDIDIDVNNSKYLGGIVGTLKGTLYNCTSDIDLAIYNTLSDVDCAWYLGGLAGIVDGGTIDSCTFSSGESESDEDVDISYFGGMAGYMISGTITNCSVTGEFAFSGDFIGGMVGWMKDGTVSDCTFTEPITTEACGNYIGGMVGYMQNGTVSGCTYNQSITATGDFVGGIVGYMLDGTVDSCYYTYDDDAIEISFYGQTAGGIVGYMKSGTVSNCKTKGDLTAQSYTAVNDAYAGVGGIVGHMVSGTISDCKISYSEDGITTYDYVGGIAGYVGNGTISGCTNNTPVTAIFYTDDDDVNYAGTCAGGIVGKMVKGTVSSSKSYGSAMADKYAGGIVGYFSNDDNDEGCAITSCTSYATVYKPTLTSGAYHGGVVGYVNCATVESCTSAFNVTANGYEYVGGIAGYATGGTIFTDCNNKAKVTAINYCGGIAGWLAADCQILSSQNNGQLTFYKEGSTLEAFGGIAGVVEENCIIDGCYNYEDLEVTGSIVGGIAGQMTSATLTNCENTVDVSASGRYVGGIVGKMLGSNTVSGCTNSGTIFYDASISDEPPEVSDDVYDMDYWNALLNGEDVDEDSDGFTTAARMGSAQIKDDDDDSETTEIYNIYVGGIAGYASLYDVISECTNDGESVYAAGQFVGGIAGFIAAGTVKDCTNNAAVECEYQFVGGIVGYLSGNNTLSGCYNYGNVTSVSGGYGSATDPNEAGTTLYSRIGGMVGASTYGDNISGCYNYGTITGASGAKRVGGIAGQIFGSSSATNSIADCCNYGAIVGSGPQVGGIAGIASTTNISGCSNGSTTVSGTTYTGTVTCSYSGKTYCGGIAGTLQTSSTATDCVNSAAVTASDGYTVGGIAGALIDSSSMSGCTNSAAITAGSTEYGYVGGIVGTANGESGEVTLTNCTNYSAGIATASAPYLGGIAGYLNIAQLSGCTNYATIAGSSTSNGGIIGEVSTDCDVSECYNYGAITGSTRTGGIAGRVLATSDLTSTINDCHNTGTVTTSNVCAGGIAGVLTYATISNCTNSYSNDNNSGAVTATSTSTSVDGARLGGIVGQMQNASTVSSCTNSADVTASGSTTTGGIVGAAHNADCTITECVNSGTVSNGVGYAGGIVGYFADGGNTVSLSYNVGEVSAPNYVGGILGYNSYSTDAISQCFNVGNITASTAYAGGLGGSIAGTVNNCYSGGTISATDYVGGLVGYLSGSTTSLAITTGYFFGEVSASGTAGDIIGYDNSNSSSCSINDVYFLAQNALDNPVTNEGATSVSYAELASLEISDWTCGDSYSYPRITGIDDNDYAKAYAAAVIPTGTDTYDNITNVFYLGLPDGVTWTWSSTVSDVEIVINGDLAYFESACEGEAVMTATSSDVTTVSVDTELMCYIASGIDSTMADSATGTLVAEQFYNLNGQQVAKPTTDSKNIYIVVRKYSDGTATVTKTAL